jgi:uncharacterized protein YjbI with pentapeptide repeats
MAGSSDGTTTLAYARPARRNPLKTAGSLIKALAKVSIGEWSGAVESVLEGLFESLENVVDARRLGALLISRSLSSATLALLKDRRKLLGDPSIATLLEELCTVYADVPIPLDPTLTTRPEELAIAIRYQVHVTSVLAKIDPEIEALARVSFSDLFKEAVFEEYASRTQEYAPLLEFTRHPIGEEYEVEREWDTYRAHLRNQVLTPVLDESFGIGEIFVWPRAYFPMPIARNSGIVPPQSGPDPKRRERRSVVGLREELDAWILRKDADDAVRFLAGDPGLGKSSFARMYAVHRIIANPKARVVIIPLNRILLESDLQSSLEQFANEDSSIPRDLLNAGRAVQPLVLIFDGLDETTRGSDFGPLVAQRFVSEALRTLRNRNSREVRIRAVFTGRPMSVLHGLVNPDQVLHLLPYYLSPAQVESSSREFEYHDPDDLLHWDLRRKWWEQYERLTGRKPWRDAFSVHYEDLTVQPLLNHLLAILKADASDDSDKDFARNSAYHEMINRVYNRAWQRDARHPATARVELEEFHKLLELMALAVWRRGYCSAEQLSQLAKQKGFDGVIRSYQQACHLGTEILFVTFYLRRVNSLNAGEACYEFSHKTFVDYLVSRAILGEFQALFDAVIQRGHGSSLSRARHVLGELLGEFSEGEISPDIATFLEHEIQSRLVSASAVQERVALLLNECLANDLPCELLRECTFADMKVRARNLWSLLLALHSCAAKLSRQVTRLSWPAPGSAARLIAELRDGRPAEAKVPALSMLTHLDFTGQDLRSVNLAAADLESSVLECVDGASFQGASLTKTTLSGSAIRADFSGAVLLGFEASHSDLADAIFEHASLDGASLRGARLFRARFAGASLAASRLDEADLRETDFRGANLEGAGLSRVEAVNASFTRACMKSCDLTAAQLTRAQMDGADLTDAILEGTELTRAG